MINPAFVDAQELFFIFMKCCYVLGSGQRFSTFSDSRTTWQILSRFADHHKNFYIFPGKILKNFFSHLPKKSLNFSKFLVFFNKRTTWQMFFRDKHWKIISISIYSLVIVTHIKTIMNSQPWSRPTRQLSADHQWAAAHRLSTSGLGNMCPDSWSHQGFKVIIGNYWVFTAPSADDCQ